MHNCSDLKNCRNGKKRREVHAEIVRYKQHWTREHDRVLAHVNEHLSRGGVWSKVQQLRTIYASLTQ
ncbi:hypothetical protein ANCCAN_09786 [Ancylostoma caninum]|uniref:Uncharacterized protein n=1 Tax=Ancylostoma caninum TaxID=29170 RepID=A0A368GIJ9_ANCCA|nr:hypothetical protein ANCCAN_09786 [Ancylostoma caninum]